MAEEALQSQGTPLLDPSAKLMACFPSAVLRTGFNSLLDSQTSKCLFYSSFNSSALKNLSFSDIERLDEFFDYTGLYLGHKKGNATKNVALP